MALSARSKPPVYAPYQSKKSQVFRDRVAPLVDGKKAGFSLTPTTPTNKDSSHQKKEGLHGSNHAWHGPGISAVMDRQKDRQKTSVADLVDRLFGTREARPPVSAVKQGIGGEKAAEKA